MTMVDLSILVVEDEFIIGAMLCQELECAGATAIGPVCSVADAMKKIESQIVDLVVLDAKLVGSSGGDLVACLRDRQIPYVVISGYEAASLPTELKGAPFVAKPLSVPILIEAIKTVATTPGCRLPSYPMARAVAVRR
jgi:CheY-like chemotaxis protein